MRRRLVAGIGVANGWFSVYQTYRAYLVFDCLTLLVQVYLLRVVFVALYAHRSSVDGVALSTTVTFLTLANLLTWLTLPTLAIHMQQRASKGLVAVDLVRPVGYVEQMLFAQAGATAARLPLLVPAIPLALLAGGLQLPSSPLAAAAFVLSVSMGYLVSALMGLLLGLTTLWTLQLVGFMLLYRFIAQFFAGALVPLWFFPDAVRAVADWLPFQCTAFIPALIYLGQLTGEGLLRGLLLQAVWVAVLTALVWATWRRAFRRVVVQGG